MPDLSLSFLSLSLARGNCCLVSVKSPRPLYVKGIFSVSMDRNTDKMSRPWQSLSGKGCSPSSSVCVELEWVPGTDRVGKRTQKKENGPIINGYSYRCLNKACVKEKLTNKQNYGGGVKGVA